MWAAGSSALLPPHPGVLGSSLDRWTRRTRGVSAGSSGVVQRHRIGLNCLIDKIRDLRTRRLMQVQQKNASGESQKFPQVTRALR